MGDSALIIKHLMETDGLKNLNEMLDPAEKAKDLALRALLEDKLYFYHVRPISPFLQMHVDGIHRCVNVGSTTIMPNVIRHCRECHFQHDFSSDR